MMCEIWSLYSKSHTHFWHLAAIAFIPFVHNIRFLGGLSAHSYDVVWEGGLLVAVGGRASRLLWASDRAARAVL